MGMNFYPFHIGDYAAHTRHLSLLEDLAYRRLIDAYYLSEVPFKGSSTDVARLIGMRENLNEVEFILSQFFLRQGDSWIQERADKEIKKYRGIQEQKSRAGKASAMRRSNRNSTDVGNHRTGVVTDVQKSPTSVQPTKNQEPRTNINTKEDHRNNSSIGETEDCQPPANPGRHVAISVLLRNAGMKKANVMNPTIACEFATDERITDEILTLALKVAAEHQKITDISPAYLKPIIEDLLNPPKPKPKAEDWSWMRSDQGIEKKGRELGIRPGATESYGSYADRIKSEIIRRKTIAEKGQAA